MFNLISCKTEDASLEAIAFFKKSIAKAALSNAAPDLGSKLSHYENLVAGTGFHSRLDPLLVAVAGKHFIPSRNPAHLTDLHNGFEDLRLENRIRFSLTKAEGVHPAWVELFLNLQKQVAAAGGQKDFSAQLGCEFNESAINQFQKSMNYLEENWKPCSLLVNSLISDIAFLKFNNFESGVSLNTFGAMFVNPLSHWSFEQYIEVLVHEMSHLQLMLHEQLSPYILNAEVMTESPIRSDRRPLGGVFHGTFALLRMTEVFLKLAQNPAGLQGDFQRRARHNLNRLNYGIEILSSHARLSEAGHHLFESMKSQTKTFESKINSL